MTYMPNLAAIFYLKNSLQHVCLSTYAFLDVLKFIFGWNKNESGLSSKPNAHDTWLSIKITPKSRHQRNPHQCASFDMTCLYVQNVYF